MDPTNFQRIRKTVVLDKYHQFRKFAVHVFDWNSMYNAE